MHPEVPTSAWREMLPAQHRAHCAHKQTPYTLRNEQEAVNLSFSLQRGYPASLVCLQAPPGLRVQKGLQFNGDKFNSPHKNKSRQISKNLPFPVPDDSKLTEGLSKTEQAEAEPSSLHWSSTKPHQGSPAPYPSSRLHSGQADFRGCTTMNQALRLFLQGTAPTMICKR